MQLLVRESMCRHGAKPSRAWLTSALVGSDARPFETRVSDLSPASRALLLSPVGDVTIPACHGLCHVRLHPNVPSRGSAKRGWGSRRVECGFVGPGSRCAHRGNTVYCTAPCWLSMSPWSAWSAHFHGQCDRSRAALSAMPPSSPRHSSASLPALVRPARLPRCTAAQVARVLRCSGIIAVAAQRDLAATFLELSLPTEPCAAGVEHIHEQAIT